MNVTDKEIKCCQPPKEGSLQKNSSENEGYARVYDSLMITENNITNANKRKLRNRRIPNGTYGGVEGRLLN